MGSFSLALNNSACVHKLFLRATSPSLVGYQMVGLYPIGMLVMWGIVGIVEMIIAALVGGWIYKEA